MKKIISILLPILFLGLILSSCSEDDSTNPSDNSNTDQTNPYFPYKKGSEAVYKIWDLDDNGNIIDSTMAEYKSIVINIDTMNNKKTWIFENQNMNGDKIGMELMSATKTQIFQYFKLMPEFDFDLPVEIQEDWYLIFDDNQTRWDLYSTYLGGETLNYGGFNITLKDTFKIYVTYDGMESVTWGDNNQYTDEAKVFTFNYEYLGKAEISMFPASIPFTAKYHFYWVKDVGLVKTQFDKVAITMMQQEFKLMDAYVYILQSIQHPLTLY